MISLTFWQLPGPNNYVERVLADLHSGANIILRLPLHIPPNLRSELRMRCEAEERLNWLSATPTDEVADGQFPLHWLWDHYLADASLNTLRTVASFAETFAPRDAVLWIEGITHQTRPMWIQFMRKYAQYTRNTGRPLHSVLCLVLNGAVAASPVESDAGLAVHTWQHVVTELDMLLYASTAAVPHAEDPLQAQASTALLAALAQFDPAVINWMALNDIADLANPTQLLREFGKTRDWHCIESLDEPGAWASGYTDGPGRVHPAVLALRDDVYHLNYLIWRAELAIYFPLVETRRRALLDTLGNQLQLPHRTPFGELITDRSDLELSHIIAQLRERPYLLPPSETHLVRCLRDIRNYLAHQEPLPCHLLTKSGLATAFA